MTACKKKEVKTSFLKQNSGREPKQSKRDCRDFAKIVKIEHKTMTPKIIAELNNRLNLTNLFHESFTRLPKKTTTQILSGVEKSKIDSQSNGRM